LVADIEPGSQAWSAGLRKDDVIVSVNRITVRNVDEMRAALTASPNGILMNIRRGNGALFLAIR
jgi:S1-C subfamily serine protease